MLIDARGLGCLKPVMMAEDAVSKRLSGYDLALRVPDALGMIHGKSLLQF